MSLERKIDELNGRKLRLGSLKFSDIVEVLGEDLDKLEMNELKKLLDTEGLEETDDVDTSITSEEDIKQIIYSILNDNDEILLDILENKIEQLLPSVLEQYEELDNSDDIEYDNDILGMALLFTVVNNKNKLNNFIETVCTDIKSTDEDVNKLRAIVEDDVQRESFLNALSVFENIMENIDNGSFETEHGIKKIEDNNNLRFMLASDIRDVLELRVEKQDTDEPILSLLAKDGDSDSLLPLCFSSHELLLESLNKSGNILDIISKAYEYIQKANKVIKLITKLKYDNKIGLICTLFQSEFDHAGFCVTDSDMKNQINNVYGTFTGKVPNYCMSNYLGEIIVNGFRGYLMLSVLKAKHNLDKISKYTEYVVINKDNGLLVDDTIDINEYDSSSFIYMGLKNELDDRIDINTDDCITILQFLKDNETLENIENMEDLEVYAMTLLSAYEQISAFF